ncbi:N,N'-diacetylchitobiose transport system permease protein [Mumia flava]|uniref:N,N'-diacetylchitobiose transport system permease protein n=1 Tax=Mumia flava TaxID=1348852 RepID=A0A0B2BL90_9ACTN|nr:carbohydrate ABC transporter permease [Mumia flava]PJJ54044.1 N,N'-diacetylchitobiose transport system permease protein [Mumia flava]
MTTTTVRRRRRTGRRALSAFAIVLALVWAFPVYWMVNSSFQPVGKLRAPTPAWVPFGSGTSGEAYGRVLDADFWDSMQLSLTVTFLSVAAGLVFAFLAALAISRFRIRGKATFIVVILVVQMIPAEALFISQYKMLSGWGLFNSVAGLTLLYLAMILPFTVWMLRGFVAGVPAELEEAAMVDGCSRFRAFFTITFPLLAPGLVAAGVYGFLQCWNEITLATVVMDPSNRTVPLWLQGMTTVSNEAIDWPAVMAGATLVAVPVIGLFMFVQNRMTSGMVSGAVKG